MGGVCISVTLPIFKVVVFSDDQYTGVMLPISLTDCIFIEIFADNYLHNYKWICKNE